MADDREMIVCNGEQIDELVRCRDCKHYKTPREAFGGKVITLEPNTKMCINKGFRVGSELWYCADGERKEDADSNNRT